MVGREVADGRAGGGHSWAPIGGPDWRRPPETWKHGNGDVSHPSPKGRRRNADMAEAASPTSDPQGPPAPLGSGGFGGSNRRSGPRLLPPRAAHHVRPAARRRPRLAVPVAPRRRLRPYADGGRVGRGWSARPLDGRRRCADLDPRLPAAVGGLGVVWSLRRGPRRNGGSAVRESLRGNAVAHHLSAIRRGRTALDSGVGSRGATGGPGPGRRGRRTARGPGCSGDGGLRAAGLDGAGRRAPVAAGGRCEALEPGPEHERPGQHARALAVAGAREAGLPLAAQRARDGQDLQLARAP